MPLSDFLNVTITTAPVAPTQPGFGVPMVLGAVQNATYGSDLIRYYTSLAGMTGDGFLTTDPEYLAVSAMLAQNPSPPSIAVGKRTNKPTMRVAITVLQKITGKVYTATVNGVAKNYTALIGDGVNEVAAGLAAAIGSPTGFGAALAVGAVVTMTASVAGNWMRIQVTNPGLDMDIQQTNADGGIATDIGNISTIDSNWYAVTSVFSSQAEVAALAAWVESNQKLYVADTQDSTILGAGSGDIASTLKTSAYVRSPVAYHPDNGAFFGSAWAGKCLPFAPGSETWKFQTPAGVAATVFTATQITRLTSKRCNYLYTVAGINMTAEGITPSGQFIDTVRGRDWLQSRIQNRIFTVLTNPPSSVNPANPSGSVPLAKIPFTDQGIAVVEGEIRAALAEGINNGFLAASPAPSVSVPKASAVTSLNKSNRSLQPVSFAATIAGAIHNSTITGVVTF